MIKVLVSFVVGVYAGLYLDQNYKVPKVTDPAGLYQTVVDYMEQHKKDGKNDK